MGTVVLWAQAEQHNTWCSYPNQHQIMRLLVFLLFTQAISTNISLPPNIGSESNKEPLRQILLSKPAGGGFILKIPGRTYREVKPKYQKKNESYKKIKHHEENKQDISNNENPTDLMEEKEFLQGNDYLYNKRQTNPKVIYKYVNSKTNTVSIEQG